MQRAGSQSAFLISAVILLMLYGCARATPGNTADQSVEANPGDQTCMEELPEPFTNLIVRFNDCASQEDIRDFCSAEKLCIKKRFKSRKFDLTRLFVLEPEVECNLYKLIDELNASSLVKHAEPNYRATLHSTPNDPSFSSCWGLHNTGQTGGVADCDIDAPEAWDITTGSDSVLIAMIDSGVDYNHPDLAANIWTNPGEIAGNGIDDDGNTYIDDIHGWDFAYDDGDPMDGYGHGTHCSGIIAAVGNDSNGICGVCWNAKIVAVKWFDDDGYGNASEAIQSIYYALDVNARILSNSWSVMDSWELMDAVIAARDDGALFVAASGNAALDCDSSPFYPACYDFTNIISVAASNAWDQLWANSDWGAVTVDLAAPGQDIYSTMPISQGSYATKSGTSMATPHVAGVAALLLSVNPGLTVNQLKAYILNNVDPIPAFAGKMVTGGRLNAYNAVAAAFLPAVTINSVNPSVVGPTQDSNVNWVSNASGTYYVEVGGTGNIGTGTQIATGSCTASVPVNTTVLASDIPDDTTATVWVMVDDAGTVGKKSTQITDDHTPPASDVTQPADGSSPGSLDSITGAATDTGGSTVATVEVSLYDGSNYYTTGSGDFTSAAEVWLAASGTDSWSLDTGTVPWQDGASYTVRSRATDAVGNVEIPGAGNDFTFTLSSVTINSVTPSVVGPAQDSTINWVSNTGGTYYVEVGGTGDIGSGTQIATGSCTSSVPVDTPVLASDILDNTIATIWVIVDDSGTIGNNSTQIRDDHTPPASDITQPADSSSPDSLDSVTGTATDTGGSTVASVEVSLYDGSSYYTTGSGDFTSAAEVWLAAAGTTSWSLNTSAVPWQDETSYTVRSRATDAVGNIETPSAGNDFTFGGTHRPVLLPKDSKGGCSCTVDTGPDQPGDILGYFVPVLLLACAYLALRRRGQYAPEYKAG